MVSTLAGLTASTRPVHQLHDLVEAEWYPRDAPHDACSSLVVTLWILLTHV
jgi:hypothetical protein